MVALGTFMWTWARAHAVVAPLNLLIFFFFMTCMPQDCNVRQRADKRTQAGAKHKLQYRYRRLGRQQHVGEGVAQQAVVVSVHLYDGGQPLRRQQVGDERLK